MTWADLTEEHVGFLVILTRSGSIGTVLRGNPGVVFSQHGSHTIDALRGFSLYPSTTVKFLTMSDEPGIKVSRLDTTGLDD